MKKFFKLALLAVFTVSMMSCGTTVKPGDKALMYDSWGDGVDTSMVYKEGYHFHAPWKDMISYNVRNQTKTYKSEVMDKNGTEINIVVSIIYRADGSQLGALHLLWGQEYDLGFIDKKVKGAIKDVAGRYTYEELYSTKREALETEIEDIVSRDFEGNHVSFGSAEVEDVNLPREIAAEIVRTETQKKRNITSELKEIENKNLAAAQVAKALGNKDAAILDAQAEAEAIKIKNSALSNSPKYIELIEAQAKATMSEGVKAHGLGSGNVYGSDTFVMKTLGGK